MVWSILMVEHYVRHLTDNLFFYFLVHISFNEFDLCVFAFIVIIHIEFWHVSKHTLHFNTDEM